MEQTALRPKPLPGRPPADFHRSTDPSGPGDPPCPRAARRRGRRLLRTVLGIVAGTALVLCGVGLGTVGISLIDPGGAARTWAGVWQAGLHGRAEAGDAAAPGEPGSTAPARERGLPTLGIEAVDAPGSRTGALVVGVHVPGPAHAAGLARGDVLLAVGGRPVRSAAGLARQVAAARPGSPVMLTVRGAGGTRRHLSTIPGVAT
ncbi:PDZ domain-containing protein [Streptomyces sp. NPDC008313]|uniref:PDZ domain-containing protein n=1 Tax=Streptomyces sp. NPDC008313 TaxID=3364826 RepID=UPI0036EB0FB3